MEYDKSTKENELIQDMFKYGGMECPMDMDTLPQLQILVPQVSTVATISTSEPSNSTGSKHFYEPN